MSKDHALESFKRMQQGIDDKKLVIQKLEDTFSDLDTTFNFKVNSLLKKEFEKVCKVTHSNPSREIKLFMLRAVKQGRL
ncbi:hypothetical protein [Acinetobacter sp.]|uniref:hypothetical protein n=1 Tax=Acinetobacter sp. TaxID=472 RepID=UPI002FDB669A